MQISWKRIYHLNAATLAVVTLLDCPSCPTDASTLLADPIPLHRQPEIGHFRWLLVEL